MSNQIQYTVEFSVNEGKSEDFKQMLDGIVRQVEKKEPDMMAYQCYMDDEGSKCYLIEWFKNPEAVINHIQHVGPKLPELLELAPITRFEVFGNLTKEAKDAVQSLGAVTYRQTGGFIRDEN